MIELTKIDIPMSMFTDIELGALDAAARMYYDNGYQALGILVGQMTELEIERRLHNSANPSKPRAPLINGLNDKHWSDQDVAESLRCLWGLSQTEKPKLGELFDALMDVFLAMAVERLCNSDDQRNCFPIEMRLQEDTERSPP